MKPRQIALLAPVATFALAACDTEPPASPASEATVTSIATIASPTLPQSATATVTASATPPPASTTPSAPPTVGPPTLTPTAAPRPAIEDCGTELRRQGATTLDDAARDCLLRAYQAGTLATSTTSRPTIEGDLILTRLEVLGPADLRVTVDNTRDKFAAPADRVVRIYRCTTLARGQVIAGLRPLSVSGCPDGLVFEV